MSKDNNPLAPIGKSNEDEWIRRHEREVAQEQKRKGKKKPSGKSPAANEKAAEPPK